MPDIRPWVGAATILLASLGSGCSPEVARASPPDVQALPLMPGRYVASDRPCRQASRADTVALASSTGMSPNCTFRRIERTGASRYRVTSDCRDRPGPGERVRASIAMYDIPNDTNFTVTHRDGTRLSARYCPARPALGLASRAHVILPATG